MKRTTLVVPWTEGLKFRSAAQIMRAAQEFRASVVLRCGDRIASVRSILSIVTLCASMGSAVTIEVSGEDETKAVEAISQVFLASDTED
ncbi:MAG: HPr family phosphocarrier protein [Verrucomicrobiae bacterium]|nr:HPr family phosphocarrier protein [Verrucomicrobiae bacterium]